jgi:hypothetical protein
MSVTYDCSKTEGRCMLAFALTYLATGYAVLTLTSSSSVFFVQIKLS